MRDELALTLANFIADEALPVGDAVGLDRLAGSRLLLTGASGLVGQWLLASLSDDPGRRPESVTVLTRSEPERHFSLLARRKGVRILTGDIADAGFRKDLPEADAIVHAAGYGQPGRFLADPATTIALNVCATLDLFKRLAPGGRFLFMSSSEVYSGLPPGPHAESEIGTTTPAHPRACYIEGKRAGEAVCHAWRERGAKAFAARLALAYGPGVRLDDARVLNAFIVKGMAGRVNLADRGLAVRTYCYVADAVEMLWRILLDGTQAVYNVGGVSRMTIAELARHIAALMGVEAVFPEEDTGQAGAPGEVSLNLDRVRDEFGKTAFVPMETGLARTIGWMKALKHATQEHA